MQLGELQNQIARFQRRKANIVAISVDSPADSQAMIQRLGLTFALASDPDQAVVKAFGVQNPETRELALHAVYVINTNGSIVYRKVALRRPVSAELIDAIDAHLGVYPQHDAAAPRQRITVAYPQNNFQALIEVARVEGLPAGIDPGAFARVQQLRQARRSDDALFAFKRLIEQAIRNNVSSEDLFAAAAWHIRQSFFAGNGQAIKAGSDLDRRLQRVRELEQQEQRSRGGSGHDQALHTLAAARAGLTRVRAEISNQAQAWNLRYAKTSLRSYREVVHAARRSAP